MFTVNITKELTEWAVPKLESDDEFVNVDDCENDNSSETEILLEIQCVEDMEFACDMCSKTFATREERNCHIDGHFKTIHCKTCGENFIGDRQFEHHRLTNKCVVKTKVDSTTYECFVCHKENFFSLRSLKIHFNRLHMPQKKRSVAHICEYCHKKFANVYILKSHINQIHLELNRFMCKECGKVFNRASNLHWHELIHQNELPCMCKICGKSFRTLSGLNLHKRTHTGEKPYKCDICNEKSYAYNTDLKRHKRSVHHIIDRVYSCPECQQVFYEPKFLRKHMQKVHN